MCGWWSRRRPNRPPEESALPTPRQCGRVLDEHPASDAEIARERRSDVAGLAFERDMAGLQTGCSLFERRDGDCVGGHERQIGDRESREKLSQRRGRDQLHTAAVKMKGRAELIGFRVAVKEASEAASRLLRVGLRDYDVQETDRTVRVREPSRLPH